MHPTPDLPTLTPPAPRRVRVAWTVLMWCGAVAFPLVLFASTRTGSHDTIGVLMICLAVVALLLLVRLLLSHPLVALTLGLAAQFATVSRGATWELGYLQVLAMDLAAGYVMVTRSRKTGLVAATMVLTTQFWLATVSPGDAELLSSSGALTLLAMVTTLAVASSIRGQRQHAEALRAQATAQAVTAERLRIARELHDVISHSIGSIAIQAGVGFRVIDTQPAEARNALAAIEATSRETLAGLRRTLGALRRSDPEPGPGATLVDPVPGLDDLDRLAESLLDAGVHVDVRRLGEVRQVPPDVDLAAFRIVQEAVTNVVRHAGVSACRVTVDYGEVDGDGDGALTVEVVDDGAGSQTIGAGYGIVGMRERVELLDGELSAGPRPEGGFRVWARLPLREETP